MSEKNQYSDEHLNAFIDNQLDTTEKAEILDAIRHDVELSQRICELQKLHNLLQLSYQTIKIPERQKGRHQQTQPARLKWIAVASFFLAIGAVVGWTSQQMLQAKSLINIEHVSHNPAVNNLSANSTEPWKLMLHVSTADPHKLDIVLNEAEALLEKYTTSTRKLKLEILANSEGLALVANSGKGYNHYLQKLQQKYENLAVVACGETLKKFQRIQGKKLNLLPNTRIVPSAINQIVKQQQKGWSYIRI